ncbi:unnamed protein product, partial [Bathycoccus prasinos]
KLQTRERTKKSSKALYTHRASLRNREEQRLILRMGNLAKGASSLVGSPALVAAMLSFTIAQICKVFTHYHTHGKVDWGRLVGSGGMPSSHTALVVGLTTAIGLKDALDSSIFALCLVFSLVVMYDATGVRLHAGRQAEVLNQLIVELPRDHPLTDSRPLRDSLGHTPVQVAVGALLGMVVGYAHFNMWLISQGVDL